MPSPWLTGRRRPRASGGPGRAAHWHRHARRLRSPAQIKGRLRHALKAATGGTRKGAPTSIFETPANGPSRTDVSRRRTHHQADAPPPRCPPSPAASARGRTAAAGSHSGTQFHHCGRGRRPIKSLKSNSSPAGQSHESRTSRNSRPGYPGAAKLSDSPVRRKAQRVGQAASAAGRARNGRRGP
jgi:hypothetical protein